MICSSNTSIKTLSLYKFTNLLIKLPWINYTIHFKHVIYVEQTTIATQLNINHILRTNVHLKPTSDYASVTVVSIKGQPRILCIFLPRHTPATEAEIWIQEYGTKYTVLKLKIVDHAFIHALLIIEATQTNDDGPWSNSSSPNHRSLFSHLHIYSTATNHRTVFGHVTFIFHFPENT